MFSISVERRHHRVRTVISVKWRLTAAQFELLRDFWARDLNDGAAWFDGPVFEGLRTRVHACRFASDPPFTPSSPANGVLTVTAELELREMPRITQAERIAIDTHIACGGDLTDVNAALAELVTNLEELPQWP